MQGLVVSLDRGYPLVRTSRGEERAQHAIDLVKNSDLRAAVGDVVALSTSEEGSTSSQQTPLFITDIHERTSQLARRELVESIHDGVGKIKEQILAVNFDFVVIVQSLGKRALDLNYLERQLVMAHESDRDVLLVLTKADLAKHLDEDVAAAQALLPQGTVICRAKDDAIDEFEAAFKPSRTGVMLGRSGVGKSTLVNLLIGEEVQATGKVREKDNAGRHITVARRLVELPRGGAVIDTPGMRALGVLGAEHGLALTFDEITTTAEKCRYRDCTHTHEPGCAVMAAVDEGAISERRLSSYRELAAEVFD